MEIVSFSSDALVYFIFNKIMIQLLTIRNGEIIKESYDNLYLSTDCMVLGELNHLLRPASYTEDVGSAHH